MKEIRFHGKGGEAVLKHVFVSADISHGFDEEKSFFSH